MGGRAAPFLEKPGPSIEGTLPFGWLVKRERPYRRRGKKPNSKKAFITAKGRAFSDR